jgi:adenylate cyclase
VKGEAMSAWTFLRRPACRGALLGLACALVAWTLTRANVVRGLEDWMLDGCFFVRGGRATTARVVLIGLDDTSLDELQKSPADISPELAGVVRYLKNHGAAAIGIDLLVPETLSSRTEMRRGERGDAAALGQAIADAGNVVLPVQQVDDAWQRPLLQWQYKSLLNPEAVDFGFVDLTEDGDNMLRRQQLAARCGDVVQLHFALALHCRATGQQARWDDGLWVGGEKIPLDHEQKLRMNFSGPPGAFPVIPFREMLSAARYDRPAPVEFDGVVAIIGSTAGAHQDLHSTPYANSYSHLFGQFGPGLMPGTEFHANVYATLADRAYLVTPAWLDPLPVLIAGGLLLGGLFARLSLEWGAVAAFVHHFAWKGICFAAFVHWHYRIEMLGVLLLGLMVYSGTFAARWRRLRRVLGAVKSEAVAVSLETDPRHLERRCEERIVSVLFADVRDFTQFAEDHPPRQAVTLLNTYFTEMIPIIESHGGTLNTFMGDGIMVIFGAPMARGDHPLQEVRAAVAMVQRVHQMRSVWATHGKPDFRIGVAVHTGRVLIGTMGSPRRLDYTAIGDVVNVAARIEMENKRLGTEILISADTFHLLPNEERRKLGCHLLPEQAAVKGKRAPLSLHRVGGA